MLTIVPEGVVCLHDSLTPAGEEWRRANSCVYFEDVIQNDPRFFVIEVVHSLVVLRRVK